MFCSKCGKEIEAGIRRCPNCGASLRSRLFLIALVSVPLAIAIAIIGFKILNHYQKSTRLNEKLEEAIGRDAGYTETILKIEGESKSMTFAELFKLCEKSIDDRTNLIIELRGLYPDIDSELRNSLIEHLTAENELVRKKVSFYRKQLALSTAIELYTDHIKDRPTSSYGWDYHIERATKLKKDAREAVIEMIDNGRQFVETYKSLVDREKALSEMMHQAGLRFVPIFKKYEEGNIKKVEEDIATAQTWKL